VVAVSFAQAAQRARCVCRSRLRSGSPPVVRAIRARIAGRQAGPPARSGPPRPRAPELPLKAAWAELGGLPLPGPDRRKSSRRLKPFPQVHLEPSQSSRERAACFRILASRFTPMSSPRCELGTMIEISPLAMTSCFDPGKGPSNPNFLNRLISSRRETGEILFDNAHRLR